MIKPLFIASVLSVATLAYAATDNRSANPSASGVKQISRHAPQTEAIAAPAQETAPENAIEVPFSHSLGKDSPLVDLVKKYTVINANGDNREWKVATVNGYSACMAPNADNIDTNDDWLITVPVHMAAGNYKVSFDLGFMGSGATGVRMEVKLGNAPTVEGMIAEIAAPQDFTTKAQTKYEYNCAIPEEGYWYFGFHCITSKEQKGAVKLFNINVEAGEVVNTDPPAAGELSWELAPKGELKATIHYTAPTKTKSGADLTEITKVEITSRWGVDKFVYENVTPGQTIDIPDVEMYQGFNNRFTGVAYVGDAAGDMVEHKSIYCGKDTPLPPTNVKLVPSADYSTAILSWDAVGETGVNGGYVDPENVTYYVFDAFGSYTDPALCATAETSVELSYPDLKGQDFVAYQVTAGYNEDYSSETSSDIVIVGTPAALPFTESFTNGLFDGLWCFDPATSSSGQQYGTVTDSYFASLIDPEDPDAPEPLKSFDGDNGFYYWLPMEKDVMLGLMSLRADISTAANPVLEFRYQGQGSTIDVLLASGNSELQLVKSIDLKATPTTAGWATARIPLNGYKEDGTVNFEIRLTATHNDDTHTWSVPIDYITVRDLADTDVRIVTASASAAKVKPQSTLTFKASIHNQGLQECTPTANLIIGDTPVAAKTLDALAPDAFGNVEFEYAVPMNAPELLDAQILVEAEGDAVVNNNSSVFNIVVEYPPYPGITTLTGDPNDDGTEVRLSWDPVVISGTPQPKSVFEDFENEDYTPMSITGAGGWTVFDGDEAQTINVFYELYNPFQTNPMAFQLFNREVAQVPENTWMDAEPHSGNTFMLAPTSYYDNNDNWLISPELSGHEQTISFYAKSFSVAWPETFEVRYSTGGNSRADFTDENVLTVQGYSSENGVPEVWTLFKVLVPAGAKHFAIHHTGFYTCALFIDDVTYESVPELPEDLTLLGYYIMRDGKLITSEPVTENVYVDVLPEREPGSTDFYTYSVIPVYNHGIAKGKNVTVGVTLSGIENITIDSIDGNDRFYNLNGIGIDRQDLAPGIYIRVNGNTATKVTVR